MLSVVVLLAACGSEASLVPAPIDTLTPEVSTGGGWGPARDLFTMNEPAAFATMNSITDHPEWGDQRNFLRIRDLNEIESTFDNDEILKVGHTYRVAVQFENSASPTASAAWAFGVRLALGIPGTVSAESASISAIISGTNTIPASVWSSSTIHNDTGEDIYLRYVPESAVLTTNGALGETRLDKSLFSDSGTLLGCDALDGTLSGESRCLGYVTADFVVDQPGFQAELTLKGQSGDFGDEVSAMPGDEVTVRLIYTNTGTTQQDWVVVSGTRVAGTAVVPSSLMIMNANNPSGAYIGVPTDSIFTGVNIGAYTRGSNAIVVYKVVILQSGALECGGKWLFVEGAIETSTGEKQTPEGIIDVEGVC